MSRSPRIWIVGGIGMLMLAGGSAWLTNGPAILLDLATGSARLFCL